MHTITELPAWERLLKKILWAQLGDIRENHILDFGSGEGVAADHFAQHNRVVAIEPSEEMLVGRWNDYEYRQIHGDITSLSEFDDNTFDIILCHNVLEYIDDKERVVKELCRVLKPGGMLSVVKHNRAGRVMQLAVLLDELEKAHQLLDGENTEMTPTSEITVSFYLDYLSFYRPVFISFEENFGVEINVAE